MKQLSLALRAAVRGVRSEEGREEGRTVYRVSGTSGRYCHVISGPVM